MNEDIFTKYDEKTGEILFTFTGSDADAKLNMPCIKGNYSKDEYIIINGIAVQRDAQDIKKIQTEEAWYQLRKERNALLGATDFTQLSDSPVDKKAWEEYRKALRDLPENTTDPFDPVWPIPPS